MDSPVERVSVEADGGVEASATPSAPTTALQNPGTDPGFAQLPQDAVQQTFPNGVHLFVPWKVFTSHPAAVNAFIRKEVYKLVRAHGLCWDCRKPSGGGTVCEKHKKARAKNERRLARQRRRDAKEAAKAAKIGTAQNVADTLEAFLGRSSKG